MKEITPEEKLLRLIKSKKNTAEKPVEKPTEKPKDNGEKETFIIKEPTMDVFVAKPEIPSKEKENIKESVRKPMFIGNLSGALILLLVVTVVYFAIDFLFITPYSRRQLSKTELELKDNLIERTILPEEPKAEAKREPKAESIKPYSYYSENIANRDIFKPIVQKEGKVIEGNVSKIREKYNLIGIISGDKLQAAVEDKVGKRTYFVYKGEYIEDVLVEDILENKVILNYKGEKFELML